MSTTKTVAPGERSAVRRSTPGALVALEIVLGLLLIGCVQGGWAMVRDPLTPLGMTTEALGRAPIDTFALAGWFLFGLAAASALTLVGFVTGWKWRWAAGIERRAGHRWPWIGSIATGSVLLIFEVIELFMVPFHPVMHPLLIVVGLALVALPLTPAVRRHLSVDDRP